MTKKTLTRRAALLRIGALAGAAYTVPAFTTMSVARASDASEASSASSVSSPSSESSVSSVSSVSSGSSASSGSSGPSLVSRPSRPNADPAVQSCYESSNTDQRFNDCLSNSGVDPKSI